MSKTYIGKRNIVLKQGSISTIPPEPGTIFTGRAIIVNGKRVITRYELIKVLHMNICRDGGAAWRWINVQVNEFYEL